MERGPSPGRRQRGGKPARTHGRRAGGGEPPPHAWPPAGPLAVVRGVVAGTGSGGPEVGRTRHRGAGGRVARRGRPYGGSRRTGWAAGGPWGRSPQDAVTASEGAWESVGGGRAPRRRPKASPAPNQGLHLTASSRR